MTAEGGLQKEPAWPQERCQCLALLCPGPPGCRSGSGRLQPEQPPLLKRPSPQHRVIECACLEGLGDRAASVPRFISLASSLLTVRAEAVAALSASRSLQQCPGRATAWVTARLLIYPVKKGCTVLVLPAEQ